jgi:hypothetical protein
MKITVTQEDIDKGQRFGLGKGCPIHLAFKRKRIKNKRLKDIAVGSQQISFVDPTDSQVKVKFLPDDARAFITNFDMNRPLRPIEPFTFEV